MSQRDFPTIGEPSRVSGRVERCEDGIQHSGVSTRPQMRLGSSRRGFTLVELLVVMGIMAIIAGIGVYAIQPFQARSSVTNGGIMVQSWLNAAKTRAIRDRMPRGLRLLPGDEVLDDAGVATTSLVTKCVFIEQSDEMIGVDIYHSNFAGDKKTLTFITPLSSLPPALSYIEINGGLMRQIQSVNSTTSITLTNDFPYEIPRNSKVSYRIVRPPLATASSASAVAATQDVLKMPKGSTINLAANGNFTSYGNTLTISTPPLDILFAPNGTVISPTASGGKIVLWVTGTRRNTGGVVDPRQGQPTLIVINVKTGSIAAYPADVTPNTSPYTQLP